MRFDRTTIGGNVLSHEYQYCLNDTVRWYKDRDFNWREYKSNFVMGDYQISQERWWKTGVNYILDMNYEYLCKGAAVNYFSEFSVGRCRPLFLRV